MPIIIRNVSDHSHMSGRHEYTVRINNGPVRAVFYHNREQSLSACLYAAYEAVLSKEMSESVGACGDRTSEPKSSL